MLYLWLNPPLVKGMNFGALIPLMGCCCFLTMRWTFCLLLLLLSSCATQRQAEKYFDANPDELAAYVDQQETYTQRHGSAYAAKHFPSKHYPPALYPRPALVPERPTLLPMLERRKGIAAAATAAIPGRCPDCPVTVQTRTVYLPDTVQRDSLQRELKIERLANTAISRKLKRTEAERDFWQDKNEKKFWTLIAMAIFGFLYILFRVLAERVRET